MIIRGELRSFPEERRPSVFIIHQIEAEPSCHIGVELQMGIAVVDVRFTYIDLINVRQ